MNKEFWTGTYQANIGKLTGVCYRYTGNRQLSEDLAHDAFLKAIEKSHSFRGDGNFDAWLRRIVVNHTLQYLRNQKNNLSFVELPADQMVSEAPPENTTALQSMDFTTDELLETINQLPGHHRLVFNLYVMEEFSHAEIGDQLGISEGTSKSHLARARKKLQHLLIEKSKNRKEKADRKRAAIFLSVLPDDKDMDRLLRESICQLTMPPVKWLSLDFNARPGWNPVKNLIAKKSFQIVAASSSVIVITLIMVFTVNKNHGNRFNKTNNNVTVAVPSDSLINEKKNENISPTSATIFPDSVNNSRNKKLKTMKPLDSLALMLALTSGTANASSLKDSGTNQVQESAVEKIISVDSPRTVGQPGSVTIPIINRDEHGTFRANELYWNKDNKEVDFKGNVRVNFKDQHFQGKGTFNVLGKVYLLIVDNEQVAPGKSIKLADQDYHLSVLDATEAVSKYGDPGKNGAIVIYK